MKKIIMLILGICLIPNVCTAHWADSQIDVLKKNEILQEVFEVNNIEQILATATVDNIDFIEGDANEYGEKVYLSVDGVEIPSELVNLDFRVVNKRFPKGRKQLLPKDSLKVYL